MGLLDRLSWYSIGDDSLARTHCYDSAYMQRSLCLRRHPGYLGDESPLDSRCEHCERVVAEHERWAEGHEEHAKR